MAVPAGSLIPRRDRRFGKFELLAKLATGGMAEIFLARARDGSPADLLVIKKVLPHLAEDERFVRMFRDEARLSARIDHPNVCRVHELGAVGHVHYLAMEYLHGVTMAVLCQCFQHQKRHLDIPLVTGILAQCCAGLHRAHELRSPEGRPLDVVHRDVSPANIFITESGLVKLIDFGVAKARGSTQRTTTGQVKGKNSYMSPEQILGRDVDRRSDVFSLGICLYEGLTSSRLFSRETDFLTFTAITQLDIPDIRSLRPDVPQSLVDVMNRAFERDRQDRHGSASEFADAVVEAMNDHGGIASGEEIAGFLGREFAAELAAKQEILDAIASQVELPEDETGAGYDDDDGEGDDADLDGADQEPDDSDFHVDTHMVERELSNVSPAVPDPARPARWPIAVGAAALALAAGIATAVLLRPPAERAQIASVPADAGVVAVSVAPVESLPAAIDAAVEIEAAPTQPAPVPRIDRRPGFFSIDSQPYATIYANGRQLGVTPLFKVKLPAGRHRIRAVSATGASRTFGVTIRPGQTTSKGRLRWH